MDEIQNYTDKLRKTYRQSLDVILPFANHETAVHCNDDEFEKFLENKTSIKDLQVCIYLLERHIDLQKEIIQGLTHLQEVHKCDKSSSDYNDVVEKLIAAQNKLATLRSRTVRCLTKQIQLRSGDSNVKLPQWSSKDSTRSTPVGMNGPLTNEALDSKELDSPVTPTTNIVSGELMASQKETESFLEKSFTSFNGTEPAHRLNVNSDELLPKFDENGKSYGEKLASDNSLTKPNHDDRLRGENTLSDKALLNPYEHDKSRQEKIVSNKLLTDPNDDYRPRQVNVVSDTRLMYPIKRDLENVVSDKSWSSSNELDRCDGVQHISDSAKSGSSQAERPSQANISKRRVFEPLNETVSVELLETSSTIGEDNPSKEDVSEGRVSSGKMNDSYDYGSTKDTVVVNPPGQSNSVHCTAPDEVVSSASVKTLDWDPGMLIREILGKRKAVKTQELDDTTDTEEIQMAGYLEKLPVNKKKSLLIKSWRKRYFKILYGKLFYFEDHRTTTPISFIKLAGSQVVEIGNKCLRVTETEDSGGKSMVIRCASWTEVQDWRKALESQAKRKAKRQDSENQPQEKRVIIVDFGSSSIKAGFLENDAWPQVLFPSVYAISKEDSKNMWYGYEALQPSVRNISKLVFPLRSAVTVGKFLLDPSELIGFLDVVFKELQVDPSDYQVVMTSPVNLRDQDKDRLIEILLDNFQVAGVYMKSQAILSMYSYSATCGVVVNVGDSIDVVPIEDGYIVEPGVCHFPYGGRQITDHFIRLLSSSGYRYFSEMENYIGEYLKVKTCYVSQDFANELKDDSDDVSVTVDMSKFNLPNGDKMVTIGKQRFRAYEVLFKPELWGKDNPGLTELVYQAVMACSIDSRKDMCRNIYLSGATTKIPGLAERLQAELSCKFPSSTIVQVHAAPDRQFAAFIGAAVLASLETFDDLCITSEEWEEVGPDALKKWNTE